MRRSIARCLPLLAVVAVACGGDPPTVHQYPKEIVDNFIKSCRERGDEANCRCAIDRLQNTFTLEQFQAMEARLAKGEVPKEMVDAVADCR